MKYRLFVYNRQQYCIKETEYQLLAAVMADVEKWLENWYSVKIMIIEQGD